MLIDRELMKIN